MNEKIVRLLSWSLILSVVSVAIYLVSDVILPFAIAFILAYMIHPVVDFCCQKFEISRSRSVAAIFMIFLGLFSTLVTLITPIIYHQISLLITKIPQYKANFNQFILFASSKLEHIDPTIAEKISEYLQNTLDKTLTIFSSFFNHVWQYTLATINFFTLCVLVPFILYYFLRDWNKMILSLESVLPLTKKSKARELAISINHLLSAYIRGQLTICLILSIYYIVGLTLIGIDFALLLGLFSGFLVLIPFIGAIISYIAVVFCCYVAFGLGTEVTYVTILFIFSHVIEGYFLTPRIIGKHIGLHPVWIVFSILVSANLFGLIGIFFALPTAGIIKIIWLHIINYYKSSIIYND